MKIFVSGSLAIDRIMTFGGSFSEYILPEKINNLAVSFMLQSMTEKRGGTAGNIVYTMALLGKQPILLSQAGHDFTLYADVLKKMQLSLEGVRIIEEETTASAYIMTDKNASQITGFYPGAMRESINYVLENLDAEETIAIISPGNVADMINLPRIYKEKGIRYIYDPGQQIPVIPADDLKETIAGAAILISNKYEFDMICSKTGHTKESILEVCPVIMTTLSEDGVVIISVEEGKVEEYIVPAVKLDKVVDPTGAGDAFRAGLLQGIADGFSLESAAQFGAVCASFCVEADGTQEHRFTEGEFQARHGKTYGARMMI